MNSRHSVATRAVCNAPIQGGSSGFCECENGARIGVDCGHPVSTCAAACATGRWSSPASAEGQPARACVAWRQTSHCRSDGPREPSNDHACDAPIPSGASGFCECLNGVSTAAECGHPASTCTAVCAAGTWR